MKLLKLISTLLDYPDDALWEHREELVAALAEVELSEPRRMALQGFVGILLEQESLTSQDAWLATFDRGRAMSLLLFEHIHGESRDRGQAMANLLEAYRRAGLELTARELPDYLPLLLEFLSTRAESEVRLWLVYINHIVGMLAARAAERNSPYAVLFEILVELAEDEVDMETLRHRASEEPRDDTPEAMDRLWEEEAVRFGSSAPDTSGAPSCRPAAAPSARAQGQH